MSQHASPQPLVVVSGLPRSGTSLMMQMLAAGGMPIFTDGVRPADEFNPRGYFEYEPVKRLATDAGWVPAATGHAVKIIVQLLAYLPDDIAAWVLLLERDLDEILASQAKMLAAQRFRSPAISGEPMKQVFARHWQQAHEAQVAHPRRRVLVVSHRQLLRQPAEAVQSVTTFLDRCQLNADAMLQVIDPALYRNQRP